MQPRDREMMFPRQFASGMKNREAGFKILRHNVEAIYLCVQITSLFLWITQHNSKFIHLTRFTNDIVNLRSMTTPNQR